MILPFPYALLTALAGNTPRTRRMLAAVYALVMGVLNLVLLNGFLSAKKPWGIGSLKPTHLGFAPFLILNLVSVAAVLYAAFREEGKGSARFIMAAIPAASGLGALAFLAGSIVSLAFLWEGVTLAAVAGLLANGGTGMRKRFLSFLPWIAADVLFLLGAILCGVWLKETAVLISPPLTSGSEVQVVIIMLLFLVSAVLRLGLFPFHYWVRDLVRRTDPAWSSFFLGALNYMLAGFRLFVVAALLSRLVVSDWSVAMALIGLLSVVAGPTIALRSRDVPGYLAGMYVFQGGFLLLGVGLFSRAGIDGAFFCLLVAPLFLTSAMMAAGTVEDLRGRGEYDGYALSARLAPAAFAALLISGMSLVGLPPLDGFVGKAIVAIGTMDKAFVNPLYALVGALVLAGVAVACVAMVRMLGGIFAGTPARTGHRKQSLVAGLAPLALCCGSVLLGVFPGLLIRNFIVKRASLQLFASGSTGPGVVFRVTGEAAGSAFSYYLNWSEAVAAFALAVSLFVLVAYAASRVVNPPGRSPAGVRPFLGGSQGDYVPSPRSIATGGLLRRGEL